MLYRVAYWLFWPLFKALYRIRFIGRDNLPASGPVLLVSNHASYLDPICLGLASRRPIHFMAKEELFNYPIFKRLLPRLYAFAVRRGQSDRQALKTALERLKNGKVVGMFPQGTRVRDAELGLGQQGAALLAIKSGATVVPAAIIGTDKVMLAGSRRPRFPRLTVAFGRPFHVESNDNRKWAMSRATHEIMKAIEALMGTKDENS